MHKKVCGILLTIAMIAATLSGCGKPVAEQSAADKSATDQSVQEEQPAAQAADEETGQKAAAAAEEGETEQAPAEGEEETPEEAGKIQPNNQGYVVALCNFSLANTWRVEMQETFIQQCEEYKKSGIISDYFVTNSDGDISQQVSDMEDLVTKGVDLICLTAASPTALEGAVDSAMAAGVKVVNFDNAVETDNVTAKIILDNAEFGQISAKWLAESLGGKGKIVLLAGTAGTDNAEKRVNGAKSVIGQYPDIEIVAESYCDYDYAKGKAAVESMLSAYPEIDGVLSLGGAMTRGAIDAFEEAGRELVPMSGEANNGFLRVWKERQDKGFTSIAPISPSASGAMALRLGLDALEGYAIKKDNTLKVNTVTDETLDDFVRMDLSDSYWAPSELTEEKLTELFSEE